MGSHSYPEVKAASRAGHVGAMGPPSHRPAGIHEGLLGPQNAGQAMGESSEISSLPSSKLGAGQKLLAVTKTHMGTFVPTHSTLTHGCMHIHTHVWHTQAHTHTCKYAHIHIHTLHTCIWVHTRPHACLHTYTHTHSQSQQLLPGLWANHLSQLYFTQFLFFSFCPKTLKAHVPGSSNLTLFSLVFNDSSCDREGSHITVFHL